MSPTIRAGEPKSTQVNVVHAAAASSVVIPSVAGYRLKVNGLYLQTNDNVSITIEETDGANKVGPIPSLNFVNGINLTASEWGWFTTRVGQGVRIRTSGAATVGGIIAYQEIP